MTDSQRAARMLRQSLIDEQPREMIENSLERVSAAPLLMQIDFFYGLYIIEMM